MTIDRRSVLEVGLMGAAAGSFSLAAVQAATAEPSAKTYVLVHGAWHGGWCWKEVAEELRRMGHHVSTPTQTGLGERKHLLSKDMLVLSAGVSVQTATACSKEAVAGAVDRWTTVLAENNPDTIVALYSKDAVLWGTLSSTVRSDPAGLKAYFVGAFQALPKLTVKFGEQFVRVYGDTAVNTGYYTLFYTKDGETKSIPARYSFTFVKEGNDCKIVDHHSSAMPTPPR
jgi:hypothetical protein